MRRRLRARSQAGFTLVEVLVTISILSFITIPLATVIFTSFRNTSGTIENFRETRDLSQVAGFFVTDVQSAAELTHSRIAQSNIDLHAIRFIDPTTGWAVGDDGTIMLSNDGGATWLPQSSGTTQDLLGLAVRPGDATRAWVVGRAGTVLTTTDGGDTWTARNSGTTQDLRAAWFKDTSNGIAVGSGGTIIGTSTGGGSWVARNSTVTADLYSIAFRDGNNGIAVGASGTAVWTSNFGSTWSLEDAGKRPPTSATLRAVSVRDDSHGWAVGDGGVILTCSARCTKKDPNWITMTSGTSVDLDGVWAADSTHVWVVGAAESGYGTVRFCMSSCTSASGVWSSQTTGAETSFNDVYALDADHAWASGTDGTTATYAVDRWSVVNPGTTNDIRGISMSGTSGMLVATSGVVRVTSTGSSWIAANPGGTTTWNAVSYKDSNEALVVGDGGAIRFCTDKCNATGTLWDTQVNAVPQDLLGTIYVGGSNAWAVGLNGTTLRCASNCDKPTAVWAQIPAVPFTTSHLYGVYSKDSTHTWVVGANGTLKFFNGTTWSTPAITWLSGSPPSPLPTFRAISGVSNSDVWAVGDNGTILYWNGTTWAEQESGTSATLRSVHARASNDVWAAGSGGTVVVSTDSATWSPRFTTSPYDLTSITAASSTTQYVTAAGGTLLTSAVGTPFWAPSVDDSLQEHPAPTCPGSDELVVNLGYESANAEDVAISYVTRTVNGERQLVRQRCTRASSAEETDPFVLASEITVARYLAPGDPVLTPSCLIDDSCSSMPETIGLQFTTTSGIPFTVQATRRTR